MEYRTLRDAMQQDEFMKEAYTKQRYHRTRDIIDQDRLKSITLIGIGAIGSEILVQLSIMGFEEITIYDDDKLELHNLATTKFPQEHLGNDKVEAGKIFGEEFNFVNIVRKLERFERWSELSPITIICTDDMESRLTAYNVWKKLPNREIFIDVRMDLLSIEVITTTAYFDNYIEYWKPSEEIEDAPCTMKHTIFTSAIAAGHAIKNLFLTIMNKPYFEYEWHGLSPLSIETKSYIIPEGEYKDDPEKEETSEED